MRQSFIFHYVYHPYFFHFVSRKEGTILDGQKKSPCWAWQEKKGVRREMLNNELQNNEIAKDAFVAEIRKVEFPCVSS